jgi:rubredoxin
MARNRIMGRTLRLSEGVNVMVYGDYYVGDFVPTFPWQYTPWPPNVPPVTYFPNAITTTTFPNAEVAWECSECGARQLPSEVEVTEIVEPGKDTRTEYVGKIRPSYINDEAESWIVYDCLVCGYSWDDLPDDTDPGGASITFLYPVNEKTGPCYDAPFCECDRDAC